MHKRRQNAKPIIVVVSGVCPLVTEILPAQSGLLYGLVGVTAAELDGVPKAINLYDGTDKIMPQVTIGASGTFFWDIPAGEQLNMTAGNAINGCVSSSGSVEVALYYVVEDHRTPITKSTARLGTYVPSVTRTPNRFGNQQES